MLHAARCLRGFGAHFDLIFIIAAPGVTQNYAGSSAEAFSGKFNKGIPSRCTFAFVRGGKLNRTDSEPRNKSRYPSE